MTSAVAAAAVTSVVSLAVQSPAGAVPGCVSPGDYDHSIPGPVGGPATASTLGSSIYYATVGGDRKVYFVRTAIDEPDLSVGVLECRGGGAVDTPAVTDYDDGTALFVLAPNGRVYESYSPDGGSPTLWAIVPGAPVGGGPPAVTRLNLSGPLQLFVRGANGRLYYSSRGSESGAAWSAREDLGGGMTGVAAVGTAPDGKRLVVVVRAPNGALYQRVGSRGNWLPWTKLSGTTSASPTLATGFAGGRLDLFVTGTTGGLYQSTWTTRGSWSAFRKIDPDLPRGAKIAATGKNGRMIVYATATEAGETTAAYDHYIPGLGWSGFDLAPYTCEDCLPTATAGAAPDTRKTTSRPTR